MMKTSVFLSIMNGEQDSISGRITSVKTSLSDLWGMCPISLCGYDGPLQMKVVPYLET